MQKVKRILISLCVLLMALSSAIMAEEVSIFRLNNVVTGEHLYSTDQSEVDSLVQSGIWQGEGVSWVAPTEGQGVVRLYNPAKGDHLYTTDQNEVNTLLSQQGWVADFNGEPIFESGGGNPVYRLMNTSTGQHFLTTDAAEYNSLGGSVWRQEGISFYCIEGNNTYMDPASVQARILALKASYPEDMTWTNGNYYYSKALGLAGRGCHGFALLCSDAAFGSLPGRIHHDTSNIKIGDLLRVDSSGIPDNHTVVVTDIQGDLLTLAEGNWEHDIHWGRQARISDFRIEYIISRYPE